MLRQNSCQMPVLDREYLCRYYWRWVILVLSRYTDESVRIGEDVEVMIVEVRGDRVRLGNCPEGGGDFAF